MEELIYAVYWITISCVLLFTHSVYFGWKVTRWRANLDLSAFPVWLSFPVCLWIFPLNKWHEISINLFEGICFNLLPSVTKGACFWFLKRCPLLYHHVVTGALCAVWLRRVGGHPCDEIAEGPVGPPSAYPLVVMKELLLWFKSSLLKQYTSNYHWRSFRPTT